MSGVVLFIPKDLLSAYYVPGPGLGAEDSAVNKTDNISALVEFSWRGVKSGVLKINEYIHTFF